MTRRDPNRLRRLLDLRHRQEETARRHLAESLRRASDISAELKARTDALNSALTGQHDPVRRRHLDILVEMATPAIRAAAAAEASALGTADELRREWEKTAVRLKGIERLHENAVAERDERMTRDEARRLDDALTSRLREDRP